MSDFTCKQCGKCCCHLVIEIGCLDIVREPQLAAVAKPFRYTEGPCKIVEDGDGDVDEVHEHPCHSLAILERCPMLGDDNKCTIYPTRPNVCVGFPAGGRKCQELRGRENANSH